MKRLKRLLLCFMAATLIIWALGACSTGKSTSPVNAANGTIPSEKNSSTSESSSTVTTSKPVKITVELLDFGNIPEGQGTWADNRWTKYCKEEALKFGVDVEFVIVPRTEEIPKLNSMMASGTAPDLVHTYDRTTFLNYASMGGITQLDDYMGSAPNIMEWFGEEQLQYGRVDGKLYAIPARRASYALEGSFIRKDWLDKLGLPMPTTAEELYETLKIMKENPGKLGTTEVVPIGVGTVAADSLSEIIMSFCPTPSEEEVTIWPFGTRMILLDGYVDGLKFVNKLYHEGFFNKDFALDANAVKIKENYANNQLAYVKNHSAYPWMDLNHAMLVQSVPDARIVAFGGLKNKSGDFYFKQGVPVGFYNFIPVTAKNPEACVKYLDWLVGDGGDVLWWGFEGEHYEVKDGIKVPIDPAYNEKTLNWMRAWTCTVYNMTADRDPEMQKRLLETRFGGQSGKDYRDGILMWEQHCPPGLLLDSVVQSQIKYSSALGELLNDGLNRIISGPPEKVESEFEKLKQEFLNSGGKEIIEESTAAYKKMKK